MPCEVERSLEERLFYLDEQVVELERFEAEGFILDIGGGGEGIIGILQQDQVVAIDRSARELEEAPAGPIKVVMDARQMAFHANSFQTVSAFFSLMYIDERKSLQKVFEDVYRVLEPGGSFRIWDVCVRRRETQKDLYVIPLKIRVKGQEINTGYGMKWPEEDHDTAYYSDVSELAGFRIIHSSEQGLVMQMVLEKPL